MVPLELRSAQSVLANEERDFLARRDFLQTEFDRIKCDAEVKFSQAEVHHLSRKAQVGRQHEADLHSLSQLLHECPRDGDSDAQAAEFVKLRQLKSRLCLPPIDVPELTDDKMVDDTTLYTLQLSSARSANYCWRSGANNAEGMRKCASSRS
jgi:hypothetical protein